MKKTRVVAIALGAVLATWASAAQATPGVFSQLTPVNGACVGPTPTFDWTTAAGATSYTLTVTPSAGAPVVQSGLVPSIYTLIAAQALAEAGNPHVWTVTAYDGTGSTSTSTWSLLVDATPPVAFDLLGPADGAWGSTSGTTFSWSASADTGCAGLRRYRLYIDGILCKDNIPPGTTTATLASTSCTGLASGAHVWRVAAEDNTGNVRWVNQAPAGVGGWTLNVDDLAPGVAISASTSVYDNDTPPSWMRSTGVSVVAGQTFDVSASGTWCFWDFGQCTGSQCWGPSGGAGDSRGTTRPVTACGFGSLVALVGSTYYCVSAGGTFTATFAGTIYLGANDNDQWNCPSGYVSTITRAWSTPWALLSPASGAALATATPVFSWNAMTDAGVGGVTYQLYVDGAVSGATTITTTAAPAASLTEGSHTWRVRACDALANCSDSPTRSFTVDVTAPFAFSTATPAAGVCSSLPTPNLCWQTATDATSGVAKYQLWVDGALSVDNIAPGTTCATPGAALAAGPHQWFVVAVDYAGNARASTTPPSGAPTSTVFIDWAPPAAFSLVAPANGSTAYTLTPMFQWTPSSDASGLDHYELWVDGVLLAGTISPASTSFTPTTALAAGVHSFYVRAVDVCGAATSTAVWNMTTYACAPAASEACAGVSTGECDPGTRTCSAGGTWGACVGVVGPLAETCNGLDDDCDGTTDDGNPGGGAACTNGVGVCIRSGVRTCSAGVLACNAMPGSPTAEICNGLDDDCDGTIDDGNPGGGAACTSGTGACARAGVRVCSAGALSCNATPGAPAAEICNGLDDNCDGTTDNGVPAGAACTAGIGACARSGTMLCAGGTYSSCSAVAAPPTAEVCNGLDDDCDGTVDDGNPGGGAACTNGVGVCIRSGVRTCSAGVLACNAIPGASTAEICNGLDDDCDGTIDDGNPGGGAACTNGTGACARAGIRACSAGGLSCNATPGVPAAETCNGVDDDCDGAVDDSVPAGAACNAGVGACMRSGTLSCVSGTYSSCGAVAATPTTETCNGVDDDCDGAIDDSVPAGAACNAGVGACMRSGTLSCVSGTYSSCGAVAAAPSIELCNAVDDDCDGVADNGFAVGTTCTTGVGACMATGVLVCASSGSAAVCDALAGAPATEACNGIDDDCDGSVDGAGLCSTSTAGSVCVATGFCGCVADADCGAMDSGRICEFTNSLCIDGCQPGGNGCTAGLFCTSDVAAVAGVCTTTCSFDSHCADTPARPICGTIAGVRECVECTSTDATRCDLTSVGGACLSDGTCGCATDTDCSIDRRCDTDLRQCVVRPLDDGGVTEDAGTTGDGGTIGDSGAADSGIVGDGGGIDASSGTDAGTDGMLEAGGCGCEAAGAGSTRWGLAATMFGLALIARRRRTRAAKSRVK